MSEADPQTTEAKKREPRGVLPAGTRLRSYEIVSVLGQGGFGITYRARDTTLNRDVAIKEFLPVSLALREGGTMVLPRSTELAEEFVWGRKRFFDEARTLATLDRAPAVVRVFDFLEANGTAYIVMALALGETLDQRIRRDGPLAPQAIECILDPLLDGLEQVHDVGFLHRDIKPANIILDAKGNPTLIDFGAARAAMAGRTMATTAIFTPGYAAVEQFTSADQGPWTDIYGLAATLHHAITGAPPPSAFDRMLDDTYEPLAKLAPAGFAPGLLIGVDAALAVRAADRPQTIADWRAILGQTSVSAADATVMLGRQRSADATVMMSQPKAAGAKRGLGLWVGAVVAVLLLAGGGYYFTTKTAGVDPAAAAVEQAARDKLAAAEAALHKAEDDAAKLRAETEARLKSETEAAAKRKPEEGDKKAAEAAEIALRLTTVDRQHIQVGLTAMGFNTNGADGVFGARSRDMISVWQKAHNQPQTGFLSGAQNQALLKEAAPAISKFDDEQKKIEDDKKKADAGKGAAMTTATSAAPAAATTVHPNLPEVGGYSIGNWLYRLTPRAFSSNQNLSDSIRALYGPQAEIVDWMELKKILEDPTILQNFINSVGIPLQAHGDERDNVLINCGGQSQVQGMHYLFARHGGRRPANWAILDTIGNDELHLGRWSYSAQVLVKTPAAK